jgi:cap2 methyltransferase
MNRHSQRMPYARKTTREKNRLIHNGQRKLLLAEIRFLTEWLPTDFHGQVVVYAGAAPGYHIPQLIKLFPTVEWHFFDTRRFNIPKTDQVHLYQREFTLSDARHFANKNILFISDVRSHAQDATDAEIEAAVTYSNTAQLQWHVTMQPRRSLLKYRLPFAAGKSDTLAGEVQYQVWAGATSTETRLCCGKTPCYKTNGYAEVIRQLHIYLEMYSTDMRERPLALCQWTIVNSRNA